MQTFTKAERLCSKVAIDKVFETGTSFSAFSFRVQWLLAETIGNVPVQVLISVPKRNFKKAVDRNMLKRRIREAYRKNKQELYTSISGKTYHVMLVYTGKTMIEYKEIEEKIIKMLQRLGGEINLK